mmetsp:Transcript_4695/g.8013  ORF Transcript_4695/g.8013 Transcript_4695/m.8013 type:complete len:273 (-) Transcript_4695:261-1079(-)
MLLSWDALARNRRSGESASRSIGQSMCSPITPTSLLGRICTMRMMPSLLPVKTVSSSHFTSASTEFGCPGIRSLMSSQSPYDHRFTIPSWEPTTTLRPPLTRAIDKSSSSWLSDVATCLPRRRLCTERQPSPLTASNSFVSALYTISETKSLCALSKVFTHVRCRVSHILMQPSSSPEAMFFSSRVMSAFTPTACAFSKRAIACPVLASVARMDLSAEPLRISAPSAPRNFSVRHDSVCAVSVCTLRVESEVNSKTSMRPVIKQAAKMFAVG